MLHGSSSQEASHNIPAEGERGAVCAVNHGSKHTSAVAGGLAASSPLTWHAVLRFPGAGRDHVEGLRGTSVGGAVGSLGDSVR